MPIPLAKKLKPWMLITSCIFGEEATFKTLRDFFPFMNCFSTRRKLSLMKSLWISPIKPCHTFQIASWTSQKETQQKKLTRCYFPMKMIFSHPLAQICFVVQKPGPLPPIFGIHMPRSLQYLLPTSPCVVQLSPVPLGGWEKKNGRTSQWVRPY